MSFWNETVYENGVEVRYSNNCEFRMFNYRYTGV